MALQDKSDSAARRKKGVEDLIGFGWTRQQIAEAIQTSIDNLRHLTRRDAPYSEIGVRLDKLLISEGLARDDAGEVARPFLLRESTPTQVISRIVPLPAADQIEAAKKDAKRTKNDQLLQEVADLDDKVLAVLEEIDTINESFTNLQRRIRASLVPRNRVDMRKEFR